MASSSLVLRPCSLLKEITRLQIREDASCASPTNSRSVAPWLMLPPEFGEGTTVFKFYRVAEGDVIRVQAEQQDMLPDVDSICLGSLSKGWLVCIQPKDCYLFMFNPLSGKTIQLPSFETLPCVKGVIRDALSGSVESVLNHDSHPVTPQFMSSYIVKKMILSSPEPMDVDCIAMVIYGALRQLAFCRRPAEANSWTALNGPILHFAQIVFHSEKKLFFAITDNKELEAWDLHNDPIKRFVIHNEYLGSESWPCRFEDDDELETKIEYCWDYDYLVYDHQSHELFIVTRYTAHAVDEDGSLVLYQDNLCTRYPYKTQTFDVFKVDFTDHDHVELQLLENDLGNRAFFIGSNAGFALSTTIFPQLRPNSIYFTDNLSLAELYKEPNFGGHDLGIYDYKDGCFLPCYYSIDVDKIQRILPAPIWFTPDVDETWLASTLGL